MHRLNVLQDFKPYHVNEIPIDSRETKELLINIDKTNIDQRTISESWQLHKSFIIQNQVFDREFNDKRDEIHNRYFYSDHWDARFGFLSAFQESIIDKLAEEGLEIKMCPYNYLGHNISGLHISMNADVCLNEGRSKLGVENEIILLVFKYMLGRRKMVAMHDPKVLLAPTPNFDSHVCEERPVPNESALEQYIRSLVYLYEFANDNFDPVIRPRHCCPVGALILKNSLDILDLTESDSDDKIYPLKPEKQQTKPSLWSPSYSNINDKKADSMARPYEIDSGFMRGSMWIGELTERGRKLRESGISVYGGVNYDKVLNSNVG